MRQRVAERQLAVEVLLVLRVSRLERDDDVGVVPLRPDPALGVRLAPVELGEHLVGRVAAPRAVALHLPVAAQVLRRVEVDAHVEAVARGRGCGTRAAPRRPRSGPGAKYSGAPNVPSECW